MKHRRTKLLFIMFTVLALAAGSLFIAHQVESEKQVVWAVKVNGIHTEGGVSIPVVVKDSDTPPRQQMATNITPGLPKPADVLPSGEKPRIAIIIDDMGISSMTNAKRAIALPSSVTLSFLPYTPKLADLTAQAKAAGHELILHMPMEPEGSENPGPDALLTKMKPEEIRALTMKALDSFSGYDGVNNHMGSKFTASREGMDAMLGVLKEKGLFFFDSLTTPKSEAVAAARGQQVPVAKRDVFLDNTVSVAAITKQLAELEEVARKNGQAVGIGHPKTVLIQALEKWIPEAEQKGFRIVPVRELVR